MEIQQALQKQDALLSLQGLFHHCKTPPVFAAAKESCCCEVHLWAPTFATQTWTKQKFSQRPTSQWYAPHWSMPQMSGIPIYKQKDIRLLVSDRQLHRQITWHCYIYAQILEVDTSWTPKTTDPPGDALQNQQQPWRHQPRKFLPPRRP